ncbi:MAG TPA: hypothetical protein VLD39_08355 [Gammaproteobacteria bacterium]|nr:hypothetical protein [Gammaproteobacteria bacterium]
MTNASAFPGEQLYIDGLVPLLIGVTGHRDLVPDEVPQIRRRVHEFLLSMRERFADRPLEVLSPLAEGSDRLVADIAVELGIALVVPLPMSRDLYVQDFQTPESRGRFEQLCARASAVYELPVTAGWTAADIAAPGGARNRQYAQLGVFLCAHSHVLLALWDGKPSEEVGGTAQVVRFHHDDVMAGYGETEQINRQLLADDESDLVYHIAVSRDRPDGAPLAGLAPGSAEWFTTDPVSPRTAEIPEAYVRIFERTSLFNRDARAHRHRIHAESWSLAEPDTADRLPAETRRIDLLFRAADWLAITYQQRLFSTLRITHGLAFLMGITFIFYSDVEAQRAFMFAFFGCLLSAVALHTVAARGEWHSRYLEYRALAEGLRIQFYWAAAGVVGDSATKYAYDNFLQKQDIELGWIRNVMRAAGIGCDVAPSTDPIGLRFAIREWIGDETKIGQLSYYRRKAASYIERSRQLERLGQVIGAIVTVLLVGMVLAPSSAIRDPLFVTVGVLLLSVSIRRAYSHRVAEKEVIKQYEFMYKIFWNARRRLDEASNDADRRRILRALGEAALDEHAEWILLHRDRPMEQGGLWRMEA